MPTVAILIPCFNESVTIEQVVSDFKHFIPTATLYVYDNASTDETVTLARKEGAVVRVIPNRGKGLVVRQMFADIEADIYVLVDGDATYDPSSAPAAIQKLQSENLDMVVCTRKPANQHAFQFTNALGNKLFTKIVNWLFSQTFNDIFSGYRVFSRRFIKSFPAVSQGFEIEAEMTIHALQLGLPWGEMLTSYQERPHGSSSKLHPFRDGARILRTIFLLFLHLRPLILFGVCFTTLMLLSLSLGLPILITFIKTGLVPRIPTAILAASLALLANLCLFSGIVLDGISRSRLEAKRFWYLMVESLRQG